MGFGELGVDRTLFGREREREREREEIIRA